MSKLHITAGAWLNRARLIVDTFPEVPHDVALQSALDSFVTGVLPDVQDAPAPAAVDGGPKTDESPEPGAAGLRWADAATETPRGVSDQYGEDVGRVGAIFGRRDRIGDRRRLIRMATDAYEPGMTREELVAAVGARVMAEEKNERRREFIMKILEMIVRLVFEAMAG